MNGPNRIAEVRAWGPDEFEIESHGKASAVRASALDDEEAYRSEDGTEDPDLDEIQAWAEEDPDDFDDGEVQAAAGHDVTPGHDQLHHYWVAGPGLARWAESPTPWRTLVANLVEEGVPLNKAKVYASRWFIEHFGFAAGSDLNRVTHGHPPRGHVVGPG